MQPITVKKVHFCLLVFLLMNLMLGLILDTKFSAKLVFAVKVITYLSGMLLFFLTLKQRKLLTVYYSLYILSPLGVVLSWLADGIFGALVGGLFLAFLTPPEHLRQFNSYELRASFTGFMSSCCHYDIYQQKWLVLEHRVVRFKSEQSPESLAGFTISNDQQQAFVAFKEESDVKQSPIVIHLR